MDHPNMHIMHKIHTSHHDGQTIVKKPKQRGYYLTNTTATETCALKGSRHFSPHQHAGDLASYATTPPKQSLNQSPGGNILIYAPPADPVHHTQAVNETDVRI